MSDGSQSTLQRGACDSATSSRRIVLIGASNLTRFFSSVIDTARQCVGPPTEIFAALGRGRSFGGWHGYLGRRLPAITRCGLWGALEASPSAPTTAVVTDIGNDILYGYPVAQVAAWVDECLARLQDLGAETAITRLPVENLRSLSEARYEFFRRWMIPSCQLPLATVRERAFELDARVAELGEQRRAAVVPQQAAWYWLDPMHIHRSQSTRVWQTIWTSLGMPKPQQFSAISLSERVRLLQLEAAESSYRGRSRSARQPIARLRDGATIAIY